LHTAAQRQCASNYGASKYGSRYGAHCSVVSADCTASATGSADCEASATGGADCKASATYQSSYSMRTVVICRGQKGRGVKLTTHLHPQPRLRGIRSIPLLPLSAFASRGGTTLPSAQAYHVSSSDQLPRFQHNNKVLLTTNYKAPNVSVFSITLALDLKTDRSHQKSADTQTHFAG
jgi:hypothetical protein